MITINWAIAEVSGDFTGFVSAATISHNKCLPNNELSVRYNLAETEAVVKVACSTGSGLWSNYGCITNTYTTSALPQLRTIMATSAWTDYSIEL